MYLVDISERARIFAFAPSNDDMIARLESLAATENFALPQSHIHHFGPGRDTIHPNLSNRDSSA